MAGVPRGTLKGGVDGSRDVQFGIIRDSETLIHFKMGQTERNFPDHLFWLKLWGFCTDSSGATALRENHTNGRETRLSSIDCGRNPVHRKNRFPQRDRVLHNASPYP
jgi:hypothetical protein